MFGMLSMTQVCSAWQLFKLGVLNMSLCVGVL